MFLLHTEKYNSISDSMWWTIPEPIFIKILLYLPPRDILNAGGCCKRWLAIANDDLLWRRKFQHHYKIDFNISLKPGADSWRNEYKRLTQNIPYVLSQKLEGHTHQVLHVSFSHNGEMFATCSKDGYVIVWNSQHPCTEKYSHNMKEFNWKYTQFSQFNQSDSLLLVSGVHFGSAHSTSGEIAVFTVKGKHSHLRCRVVNRPYDIFGTWFSDQYLISGDLHWLAHLVSTSVLWLNKANQETHSEHVPIMNQLYKFYNRNASSIRVIMMAKCPWINDSNNPLPTSIEPSPSSSHSTKITSTNLGSTEIPVSHHRTQPRERESSINILSHEKPNFSTRPDSTIFYSNQYHKDSENISNNESSDEDDQAGRAEKTVDDDDMENFTPKYLIFSTGSKTYTPHQIGIKRIRNVTFPKRLDVDMSLVERYAAKKRSREDQTSQPRAEPEWWNFEAVSERFEKVDKVIDLHGHIIGMALSPDHRYLYVNTRSWPKNYVISNPLEPPPIAQEIDIHVIDLMTLETVGNMFKTHKAYTPSTECFFIFLDVCDNYVASGAEDMFAYLWDRFYGICLAKYKHDNVVNSVAFNPKESDMLVTTSDDYTIKIWRSRESIRKYVPDTNFPIHAVELKSK